MSAKNRDPFRHPLNDALRVSKGILDDGKSTLTRDRMQLFRYLSLVRSVRLAEAIDRLANVWAYEAIILLRTLFEVWVNLAWISRDPSTAEEYAKRFEAHELVERVKLWETVENLAEPAATELEELVAQRDAMAGILRKESGGFERHWAGSREQMIDRLNDIVHGEGFEKLRIAGADDKRNNLYFFYRLYCGHTHANAQGMSPLLDQNFDLPRIRDQPYAFPFSIRMAACAHLLWIAGSVLEEVGPSRADAFERAYGNFIRIRDAYYAARTKDGDREEGAG